MAEQLTSEFKRIRYDILIRGTALIIQPPADTHPVLPAPVPYPAMNSVGNSNSERIKFIQLLQQQMTMLGNHQPPNPSDIPQNRIRHKRKMSIYTVGLM